MFVINFCVNIMVVTNNTGLLSYLKKYELLGISFSMDKIKKSRTAKLKISLGNRTIFISGLKGALNSEC